MTPPRVTMRPVWLHIGSVVLMLLASFNAIFLLCPVIYNYPIIAFGFVLVILGWIVGKRERESRLKWQLEQMQQRKEREASIRNDLATSLSPEQHREFEGFLRERGLTVDDFFE